MLNASLLDSHRFAEGQPNDLAVGFAFGVVHRPSIDVIVVWMEACRINSCCTFIGAPVSSSHERVGVAERMPSDPVRQADEFGNPVELMRFEALLVEGLPSLWIGEDPICIAGICAEGPPFQQQSFQDADRAKRSPLKFRLHRIYPSADNAALNHEGCALQNRSRPTAGQGFR